MIASLWRAGAGPAVLARVSTGHPPGQGLGPFPREGGILTPPAAYGLTSGFAIDLWLDPGMAAAVLLLGGRRRSPRIGGYKLPHAVRCDLRGRPHRFGGIAPARPAAYAMDRPPGGQEGPTEALPGLGFGDWPTPKASVASPLPTAGLF